MLVWNRKRWKEKQRKPYNKQKNFDVKRIIPQQQKNCTTTIYFNTFAYTNNNKKEKKRTVSTKVSRRKNITFNVHKRTVGHNTKKRKSILKSRVAPATNASSSLAIVAFTTTSANSPSSSLMHPNSLKKRILLNRRNFLKK